METNKLKILHMRRGSRVLEDDKAEAIAYLMADQADMTEIVAVTNIPEADVATIMEDDLFKKRVAYLSNKANRKKQRPKTNDEFKKYALKKLHKLAESAKADKDKIAAAEVLGKLAHQFEKDRGPEAAPPPNNPALAKLIEGGS